MEISLLDSIGRKAGIVAITGYQKHISPHKGFVCAHRVLYGGESCSQYIKRVITEDGFKALLIKSRRRFQACLQANRILRSAGGGNASLREASLRDAARMPTLSPAQDSEPSEDESESYLDSPKKAPGRNAEKSSFSSGDNTQCVDCADLGCNCGAELFNVTPDCSALDCHSLDCSGADCGSLDCGGCG
jgi:putative component of membrane protein insertase Oxa1/YidC/SpoIIIJ protein YidD